MSDRRHDAPLPSPQEAPDSRAPYEAPRLTDLGDVAEVTQSGIPTIPGADAVYS